MRKGSKILVLATAALALGACGFTPAKPDKSGLEGQKAATGSKQATSKTRGGSPGSSHNLSQNQISLRTAYPEGPTVTDPQGLACAAALQASGVNTSHLSDFPEGVSEPFLNTSIVSVTLASSLESGPVPAQPDQASGIETATWNLLSTASGYSLNQYLGQTVSEVTLDNWGSLNVGDYICFEQGTTFVGMLAQEPNYNFQPMSDIAVNGKTVSQLTGQNYLQWLESVDAYVPSPAPNTPSVDALGVLLDSLAVLNANLPAADRAQLESQLATTGGIGNILAAEGSSVLALVPLDITPSSPPPGSIVDPQLYQEFDVQLWPEFRDFSPQDLAGNGFLSAFYSLQRPDVNSPWQLSGLGTGP